MGSQLPYLGQRDRAFFVFLNQSVLVKLIPSKSFSKTLVLFISGKVSYLSHVENDFAIKDL